MNQNRRSNKKWNEVEDQILLRYVRANPINLHKAFVMVSEHLTDIGHPRSVGGVQAHWYTVLSKKPESKCFFTASARHVSMNRKNGAGVASTASIWRKLLSIIKNL